jgi:hypothetical protein
MSSKHIRELSQLITKRQLRIDAARTTQNSGSVRMWLIAPNGAEKQFFFSINTTDPHAQLNNRRDIVRFAEANTPSVIPKAVSKSIIKRKPKPPTAMAQALQAAQTKVVEPTHPTTPAALTKPNPTNSTTPETTPMTRSATPNRRLPARLTAIEFFKLCEWIKTQDVNKLLSVAHAARLASEHFGRPVATSTVDDALKATNVQLPSAPAPKLTLTQLEANQAVLARALSDLMQELNMTPGADLLALVSPSSAV